jgi:hypothetical protein
MPDDPVGLTALGGYLNVSAERAVRVAADDPTFPAPASGATPPLEPRQGRAMGRVLLVGYEAMEASALESADRRKETQMNRAKADVRRRRRRVGSRLMLRLHDYM